MAIVRATVIKVDDLPSGETTVQYEYEPAGGMQNVTLRTLNVPGGLACGDAIQVMYDWPNDPTITKE